jgi:hypothetical protein
MDIPPSIQLGRPNHRRKRRSVVSAPLPPGALTLVSAWFDDTGFVILGFDRAIDIAGLVGSAIVVNAPIVTDFAYAATGPTALEDPATVRISVVEIGPASGDIDVLNAGAGNGIVAVDDATAWAGVSDLELPFP